MSADPFDPATVRLWCRASGIEVGERGRISDLIKAKYLRAGMPTREAILAANPELAPVEVSAPPKRIIADPDEVPTIARTKHVEEQGATEAVAHPSVTRQKGKKVLLPHHYDPRPALFSADSMNVQEFWKIIPTRKFWTVEEVEELMHVIGEPAAIPGIRISEMRDGEVD